MSKPVTQSELMTDSMLQVCCWQDLLVKGSATIVLNCSLTMFYKGGCLDHYLSNVNRLVSWMLHFRWCQETLLKTQNTTCQKHRLDSFGRKSDLRQSYSFVKMHRPKMKGSAEMAVAKVSHHELVPPQPAPTPTLQPYLKPTISPHLWWLQRMKAHQQHTTPSPPS